MPMPGITLAYKSSRGCECLSYCLYVSCDLSAELFACTGKGGTGAIENDKHACGVLVTVA